MFSKALGIQSCVEGFHGTDYSEDTIYRESIDELVLIREKKQFNKKVSRLMNVVINAFSNQNRIIDVAQLFGRASMHAVRINKTLAVVLRVWGITYQAG